MQVETYQLFALFLATAFFLAGAFLVTFLRVEAAFFAVPFLVATFFLAGAFFALGAFFPTTCIASGLRFSELWNWSDRNSNSCSFEDLEMF